MFWFNRSNVQCSKFILLIRKTQIFRIIQAFVIPFILWKKIQVKSSIWFYILVNIVISYHNFYFFLLSSFRFFRRLENKTKFNSLLFFTYLTLSWFRFFPSYFLLCSFAVRTCSMWILSEKITLFTIYGS